MSDDLTLLPSPEIPPELLEAAKDGKLVLFVGAGASMLVGMPSWSELASKALDELTKQKAINFAEKHALLAELDPRKQLSIAEQIASDGGHDLRLGDHLVSSKNSQIYEAINSTGAACVTTNYDHELTPIYTGDLTDSHTPPATKRISQRDSFKAIDLKNPGTVVHLHGEKSKPSTMIVSTKDYLRHYDHPKVQYFLKELFSNNVVLFIGYGLEEAEILEHILRRSEAREDEKTRNRFSLQPFFSRQQSLYERLVTYYERSFGVHLIGFNIDANGYDQLEHIILDWTAKLNVQPPSVLDEMAAIDKVIANE